MLEGNNNPTSRRAVLKGIVGGVAGASLAPLTRVSLAAAAEVARVSVTRDLTVLSGAGGNIAVLATGAGQVVVDSGAAASSAAVLAALGDLPGGRVRQAFQYTLAPRPSRLERSAGSGRCDDRRSCQNPAHLARATTCRSKNAIRSRAEGRAADRGLYTDGATKVGEAADRVWLSLEAHTDGDVFVFVPRLNVIASAISSRRFATPSSTGLVADGSVGACDSLALLLGLGNAQTRFVPSYGPVVDRAAVQKEYGMMLRLFESFVELVRKGDSAEDVLAAGVMDVTGRAWADPQNFVLAAHKGMWAHHNTLSPDIV